MSENKDLQKMKKEYESIKTPEGGLDGLQEAIERAKADKKRKNRIRRYRRAGSCAAAVLVLFILIPNVSVNAAMAMERIPLIGKMVQVVTMGRYHFEDETHEAAAEIPEIEVTDAEAEQTVADMNRDMEKYVNAIIEDFEGSLEDEDNKSLDVSYETVTDSDTWFTLKINVLEVEASGYMYSKYYHIDKRTGERAGLKDLFREGADYVTVISDGIKEQMREQMAADENKVYFIDNEDMPEMDFDKIKEDQNFYFNGVGELVIVFDEYEAAPGYMGIVEFTIPEETTAGIRK